MFNNVLDRKETFFCEKNSIFQSPKQLKNENFFFIFFRSYFDRKQIKKKITFFNKKRGLTPLEKCGLGDFKRLNFLWPKKVSFQSRTLLNFISSHILTKNK